MLTFDYQLQFGDNGEFADAVAELLRHLKEKVWLVGQSLGGVVGPGHRLPPPGSGGGAGPLQHLLAVRQHEQGRVSGSDEDNRKPAEVQKMACLPAVSAHQADDEMGGDEKKTDGFTAQEKAAMEELCGAMMELLTKPYEQHMIDFLCDAEH